MNLEELRKIISNFINLMIKISFLYLFSFLFCLFYLFVPAVISIALIFFFIYLHLKALFALFLLKKKISVFLLENI